MEQKIKNLFGEYVFTIAALQHQLETVQQQAEASQKELDELKSNKIK
jgi:hypothetical protein